MEEILGDPIKIRLYIEKLNGQLKEKDQVIKNLNETLVTATENKEPSDIDNLELIRSERSEKIQAERLRKEIEKLKITLQVRDEKLKNAEAKLKIIGKKKSTSLNNLNLKKRTPSPPSQASKTLDQQQLNKPTNSVTNIKSNVNSNTNSSSDDASNLQTHSPVSKKETSKATSTSVSTSTKTSESISASISDQTADAKNVQIQRNKNFSEIEFNNVRSRLQQRLNELEPLPELLKTTELKLHEALSKLKLYETEIIDNRRIINELKSQLDMTYSKMVNKSKETKILKDVKKTSSANNSAALIQAENNVKQQKAIIDNLTMNRLEPIERRIQHLEEENRELIRQLGQKDDLIRDLTV